MMMSRPYVLSLILGAVALFTSATDAAAQSVSWKTTPVEKQAGTLYCDGVVTGAAGLDSVAVSVFGVSKAPAGRAYRVEATVAAPGAVKDGMTTYGFSATISKDGNGEKLPNGQYDV